MPSFYTHYNFGKEVIHSLSSKIKNIIKQNDELFIFGNQGPDLFFFHILSALKGSNPGSIMHDTSFKEIVDKARYNILKLGVHSPSNVYFFGLCCHFLLDATVHPTVDDLESKNYTHLDIESELDRYFLNKNNEDEFKFNQYELVPSPDIAEYIYPIYAGFPEVSKELIYRSIKDMKLVKKIFQARGKRKEKFILNTLKFLKMDGFSGQLIRQVPFKESENSNIILEKLYNDALDRAPSFLDEVYSYVYEGAEAPEEFRKDFNGV